MNNQVFIDFCTGKIAEGYRLHVKNWRKQMRELGLRRKFEKVLGRELDKIGARTVDEYEPTDLKLKIWFLQDVRNAMKGTLAKVHVDVHRKDRYENRPAEPYELGRFSEKVGLSAKQFEEICLGPIGTDANPRYQLFKVKKTYDELVIYRRFENGYFSPSDAISFAENSFELAQQTGLVYKKNTINVKKS